MGLRIFSIRELKASDGLFGPAAMALPFKLFGFKTFWMMSLLFCDIAS